MSSSSPDRAALEAFWMPFTANRQFKSAPRLLARAEGMYYYTPEGRQVLDGTAGLWCVNAGHCRPKIVEASCSATRRSRSSANSAPCAGRPREYKLRAGSWVCRR